MKHTPLVLAMLLATTTAGAQIYQWKDEHGKTIISDKPPPSNVRVQKKAASEPDTSAGGVQKPLAQRELEFRKRQKDAQDREEKAKKEETMNAQRQEYCASLRRQLSSLESGERIAMRNDEGERYFLDDNQRQQEIAKGRQSFDETCK